MEEQLAPASSQRLLNKNGRPPGNWITFSFLVFGESAAFLFAVFTVSMEIQASSSIGRASVSKTEGWGFDSLLACPEKLLSVAFKAREVVWQHQLPAIASSER